jgi:hypothetical protein
MSNRYAKLIFFIEMSQEYNLCQREDRRLSRSRPSTLQRQKDDFLSLKRQALRRFSAAAMPAEAHIG